MSAAEVTFDFDLKLKKISFSATILDKNRYTFGSPDKKTSHSICTVLGNVSAIHGPKMQHQES